LSVVLYHAGLGVRGGFVGVDVFFVISGFLITRQLLSAVGKSGIRALPTFYARRVRRLLPASATVVIATVLIARFWAPALQVRTIAVDAIYTTFYSLNYRLAVSGTEYLHQSDAVSPLQHFWSLGVEEQFYFLWPLLIVAVALIGRRFRTPLLALGLVVIAIVSFRFSVTVTKTSLPWAYFSLHTRAWELAIGALVAVGATRLARLPPAVAELGAFIGMLGMVGSVFVFSDLTPYPGSAAAIPVLGAAMVIACGAGKPRRVERLLGEPLMQCIGRVSYSWYLWHWPILILAPAIIGHSLNSVQRVMLVWLSLVAAVITYFVIEDRARALSLGNLRWLTNGLVLSTSTAVAAVLVLQHLPALVGSGAAITVVQADSAAPAVTKQMQAAVAAGLHTKEVPRNLTPQPAEAAGDTPPSSKDGCHADFLASQQGGCVFGDTKGKHTAVIFGDSHAEQWLPAFAKAGAHAHWKIVNWTKAACPPAQMSVFADSLNRRYSECDSWRTATLARIAALKPSVIVIGQSENVVSGTVSPSEFAAATVSTLKTLRSTTSARVIFMSDIPVPNYDMPSCVARHLGDAQACNFAVAKAYSYPERHRAMAPSIQKAGFSVVDPQRWLCTARTCPAVVGNYLVYRNSTHMSASFAAWLAPMVTPLLTAAR
jgi:peptidoglycan/LPS O-acetylase OafA/YrhL